MPEVSIRPITYDDTDNIIKWRNSDSVRCRFIDRNLFTKEGHTKGLDNFVFQGKVSQFIMLLDKLPVGSVYIRDIDHEKKCGEYGIFIGEESARGKGVGTESAKLIIEHAFNELKLETLFLRVFKDNEGAIKSYEHAGFVKNGKSETVNINGKDEEVIFMELKK